MSASLCEIDNDSITASQDYDSRAGSSVSSSWWQEPPMVVGYVFGPKKMKSMSVVMAEASRAQVIHEDIHEEDEEDELFYEKDQHYQSSDKNPPISTVLTTEALERLEKSTTRNSTVINFGNFNKSDLKNVVRYFRSSSSTASTPTTIATTLTRSSRFPIRISFVPLDPDWPLEEQHGGNFDLILHKLTEDILSCSLGNATNDAKARVERLKDYQHRFPTCCMLDDPNSVMTVMSRCAISRKLQTCLKGITSASGLPVKAPKFVVINDNTSNVQEQLQAEQLSVPLIVKPLIAAGTKQSHYMTIVLQESATINRIPPNSIVQEYVNHDESLYKVYVMGTYVHVYKRTSLPNLPTDMASISTKDFVKFDSQHLYPSLQDFGITEAFDRTEQTPHDTSVTPDEVSPLVDVLKRAFGLDLFGFDILLSPQKEWLVVDVNYFPSYKEVPNFPNQLAQYLTRRVSQQRRHNLVTNISR